MSMSEFWWRNGDNGFISVSVNEFIKDDENFAKMHPATLAPVLNFALFSLSKHSDQ